LRTGAGQPGHRLDTMANTEYPDDIPFAGLVEAATAAADEQTRTSSGLRKRKRTDDDDESPIDPAITNNETSANFNLQNSAAVLFREPSSKSKKYSRPPLGKVYTSLELAPENFLKLQAAGKDFMLDPSHPERRDVVGHRRQSGGTDVAKLKLWNCVEEFLRDVGHGERFFGRGAGEGIPGAPERAMFWPEDSQKIIRACMPLMRKMVTNERQRIYAAETRKPRESKDAGEEQTLPEGQMNQNMLEPTFGQENDSATSIPEPTNIQPTSMRTPPSTSAPAGSVVLFINLMALDGTEHRRIIPRFSLSPEAAANLNSLRTEIKKRAKRTNRLSAKDVDRASIKVWMPDGLVQINDDGEWMVALLSADAVEWMDGEIRVLVEI
jgi:hypothetical protein